MHELEIINGKAQMAYVGQVPWHGLGTQVDPGISLPDMLEEAGVDWTVKKVPLEYEVDGVRYSAGTKQALIRETDNKLLSVVSKTWNECQNINAFGWVQPFIDSGELAMETIGSLKNGKVVWALAKMKEKFVLFKEDETVQYLLMTNPHWFGRGIHFRSTPTRVVCNNTLSFALGEVSDIKSTQNHRKVFDVELMREALGIANIKLEKYAEMARFLGSKRFNDKTVQDYFDRVFPSMSVKLGKDKSRNATIAYDLLDDQPGMEYGKGSWWHAFNTVTYMSDHVIGRNADTRLYSSWYGTNADRKNEALELAVEYAEAA